MKKQSIFLRLIVIAGLLTATIIQAIPTQVTNAAQIVNRSLTLRAGSTLQNTTNAGSAPSGVVRHFFDFDLNAASLGTNLGSIKFEYCTTAADVGSATCVAPLGMTDTGATLSDQSTSEVTGWTISNTNGGVADENEYYVTRTAGIPAGESISLEFSGVTNPSTEGAFYVRITTYTSTTATTGLIDSGTVTAATAEQIILTGTMPESLVFCTGASISVTTGVPDCSTATSGAISFDQLFSATDTAAAKSQMAASTNAGFGYIITVNGTTMTSGANTIAANGTASASVKGTAQFGLNLMANSSAAAPGFGIVPPASAPVVPSADLATASNGTNLHGRPLPNYATADTFTFIPGATVADSNFDATGDPSATDSQIYTASYIVNVPGSQPAGTYTTTLTYICTPTF